MKKAIIEIDNKNEPGCIEKVVILNYLFTFDKNY